MKEKKKFFTTKMIATTGILTGILIVLQVIGNYINPAFANINLSLVPIALGAILYGPVVGGFLGLVCGIMVLISPSTISYFFSVNPAATVITCLFKTTLAGIGAGFAYKLIYKKNDIVASIVASIIVPIVNTGIFCVMCWFFFSSRLGEINPNNLVAALFLGMVGVNFIFEIISTVILTPSLYKIIQHTSLISKEKDL